MVRLIVVLSVLCLAAPAAALAPPRTQTRDYVASPAAGSVASCPEGGENDHRFGGVGGVCFIPLFGEQHVSIRIADVTGGGVGARWRFSATTDDFPPRDVILGQGNFCDGVGVFIPEGSERLDIYLSRPVDPYPVNCASPGFGTAGSVTATFT